MEKHELDFVTSTCTIYCNILLQDCTRYIDVDGVDVLGCSRRWQFKPILLPMYRYLGGFIDTSGFYYQYFPIVLIIDGIVTSPTAIVSMSMSQPITSMAPLAGDDDTIDNVSMVDP
jgi:hypothetical protein